MNVLFYRQSGPITGGAGNVAYYLTKALEKKVNLTYFPGRISYSYPVNLLHVYSAFLKRKFNIIHFNVSPSIIQYRRTLRWVDGNYLLLKYAKTRGSCSVLNIHGITPLENEPSQKQKYLALKTLDTAKACKKADGIIVNTEYMRSKVIAWYGANSDKIAVIPNGVDLEMFSVQNRRIVLSGDPAILFVGHLWWVKGVDILLQAMVRLKSALPEVKLHLVGDEHGHKYENDYKLVAKRNGLERQVIFHGVVPHSIIPYYYKSATLCVLPSRHEGFSITMLEVMASGTPFVASDIGTFRDILHDGENALLFKSGDAVSLSTAILRLCADSGLRRKISQNASKTVMNYSWDSIAERYVSLYTSLFE
jgi:glycosyltransferase involved in cell wall biosynthesis